MKVKCYFPEDLEIDQDPSEITKVHAIDPVKSPEYTLCSIAWEEWDCDYDYHERVTDEPITCKNCLDILNGISKNFKKTEKGWE